MFPVARRLPTGVGRDGQKTSPRRREPARLASVVEGNPEREREREKEIDWLVLDQ